MILKKINGSKSNMNILRILKNKLETNQTLSSLFDYIYQTKLYQKFLHQQIIKEIALLKKNKQYNVTIETSNFCNAQCIMCPHIKMKRKKQLMSDQTFKKIINRIIKEKINPNVFILNGFGEPLSDPKIISRIKKLKNIFRNTPIKIYSNLFLATPKINKKIIDSQLDEINISLNGYDKKSYQKTMKLDYSKTIKNIKNLIQQKKQNKSPLKIRISTTLISQNHSQIKNFLKKWQPLVDSVSINKVHNYNQSVNIKNKKFEINFQKKTAPCKNIWNSLVFDADGNLIICCLDYESQYKLGNIHKSSILKNFYSPKIKKIRQLHLNSNIHKIPICSQCYTPYKNGIEWFIKKIF